MQTRKLFITCILLILKSGLAAMELKSETIRYRTGSLERTELSLITLYSKKKLLENFKKDALLVNSDTGIMVIGDLANSAGDFVSISFYEIVRIDARGLRATQIEKKNLWKYWAYELRYENGNLVNFHFTQFELAEFGKPLFSVEGRYICENHQVNFRISEFDDRKRLREQRQEQLTGLNC